MQAKIEPTKTIRKSIRYNEEKLSEGKAEKIHAENFLKDHDRLSKEDMIDRFRQRSSFNEQMHDDGVHFSLNFGKEEKLDNEKMVRLANQYMSGMGFEDQPYVVYRHNDAGHTHLHIVATSVKSDGTRIDLHPRDYLKSCILCKSLEKEFSLEKLVGARPEEKERYAVDHAKKVEYGEPGLKHAISDVLNTVIDHYNYTSLDELNALLKEYNVEANPGKEGSRLNQKGGLLYHALDKDGHRVGVPMKASLFLLKPTLHYLEQRFTQDQTQREATRERLSTTIEWALAGRAPNWEDFKEDLGRDGISVIVNKDKDNVDRVYFVDHTEKCAFEGSKLDAGYKLEALQNRCLSGEKVSDELSIKNNLNLHI